MLVFEEGQNPIEVSGAFAVTEQLGTSRISAVGGFSSTALSDFARAMKQYRRIPIDKQVSLAALPAVAMRQLVTSRR